jgi:hypothetical protein
MNRRAEGDVERAVLVLGREFVDPGEDDNRAFESLEPPDRIEQDFPWLGILVLCEFERADDRVLPERACPGGTNQDDDSGPLSEQCPPCYRSLSSWASRKP